MRLLRRPATLAASLLAALYVGLWMAARRDREPLTWREPYDPEGLFV